MAHKYLTIEGRKRRFLGGLAAIFVGVILFLIPHAIEDSYDRLAYYSYSLLWGLVPVIGLAIVITLPFRKVEGRHIWNDWISITSFIITGVFIMYCLIVTQFNFINSV